MGRFLILLGIVLVAVGLAVQFGPRVPLLSKLGRLPGDIRVERPGFSFFFPITTSILLSVVLTGILALLRKK
jgi:hypothetical protein